MNIILTTETHFLQKIKHNCKLKLRQNYLIYTFRHILNNIGKIGFPLSF